MKGFGSDGLSVLLLAVIILKDVVVPLVINWRKTRKVSLRTQKIAYNPGNPGSNDKPGKAEECLKHMTKLAKIETNQENFTTQFKEFRQGVGNKFEEVFRQLRNRR